MTKKYKVAFIYSHPIQYYAPLFRELSKDSRLEINVYYCSDESVRGMMDVGFQEKVKWDISLTDGYNFKLLKNYSLKRTVFNAPFGLINFGIVKEIMRNNYDVIIIPGWQYVSYWLAFVSAAIKGVPILLRAETAISQELLKPKHEIFFRKIVLGIMFKFVKAFLALGTESVNFYKFYNISDSRIFTVPYAVDNDRFIKEHYKLADRKGELKESLGIKKDSLAILFSGKLIDKKRPMDLLRAYEILNFYNAVLLYVGDGILRAELEKYVSDNNLSGVYFFGFQNQKEISKFYAIADIFVLPSTIGEKWGLVVNEAMCFGLPIIVSDLVGSAADLVKPGQNGFVFKTGDIDAIANHLRILLSDSKLREKMGKASSDIISRWSYKEDAIELIKALDKVLL